MVDTSIAMGYRPVQIDNPLNQLAQLLQIQQAQKQGQVADLAIQTQQRSFDESNKLRDYFAKGDPNSPDFARGLYSISPDKAMAYDKTRLDSKKDEAEIAAKNASTDKTRTEIVDGKLKQSRQFLDQVQTPEQYLAWHEGNHADPVLGPLLKARGVTADSARAQIEQALAQPGGFQQLVQRSALGLEKFTEFNKPTYQTQNTGDRTTLLALPGLGGAPTTISSAAINQSPNNAATNATSSANNAATVANAARTANMADARAREQMRQSQAQFETGQAGAGKPPSGYRTLANGDLEAIPGGPADLKAQAVAGMKAAGASDVDSAIAVLRDAYDRLEKGGGITSTDKNSFSNIGSSLSSSGPGQVLGRALGTNNQSARNDIAMTRPALLAALMKATGMSAKQMDSNAELKLWMATATDPTLDVESNRRALNNIERKYIGSGVRNTAVEPMPSSTNPTNIRAQADAILRGGK